MRGDTEEESVMERAGICPVVSYTGISEKIS